MDNDLNTVPRLTPQVHFVWVNQTPAAHQWLPELLKRLDASPFFTVKLYCTRVKADPSAESGATAAFLAGRPKAAEMLGTLCAKRAGGLRDATLHSVKSGSESKSSLLAQDFADARVAPSDVCALACGPDPMVKDVQAACMEFGVDFHKETFAF